MDKEGNDQAAAIPKGELLENEQTTTWRMENPRQDSSLKQYISLGGLSSENKVVSLDECLLQIVVIRCFPLPFHADFIHKIIIIILRT